MVAGSPALFLVPAIVLLYLPVKGIRRLSLPVPRSPPFQEDVVNRHKDQPGIGALEKSLHQPREEPGKAFPFEAWKPHYQERVHVEALRGELPEAVNCQIRISFAKK